MDAVKLMGEILLEVAEQSKDRDSVDCMKLVVFCNAPDDNPFMAGAFHGVTEADAIINVGVSDLALLRQPLKKCVVRTLKCSARRSKRQRLK